MSQLKILGKQKQSYGGCYCYFFSPPSESPYEPFMTGGRIVLFQGETAHLISHLITFGSERSFLLKE